MTLKGNKHLNQALHNKNFVDHQCESFNKEFHDWKVTSTFYIALHIIRAMLFEEGRDNEVGKSHRDLLKAINPFGDGIYPVKQYVYHAYRDLYQLSRSSRYNAFDDLVDFEAQNKENLLRALNHTNIIIGYANKRKDFDFPVMDQANIAASLV